MNSTSTKEETYYDVLGVDRHANDDVIKTSFRRLAKQYHPDTNTGQNAANKFREVYTAYNILSDPYKRRAYDYLLMQRSYRNNYRSNDPVDEFTKAYYQRRRRRHAYRYRPPAPKPETLGDRINFHAMQVTGLIFTLILMAAGLSLVVLAIYFFFLSNFNGHMVSAYILGIMGSGLVYATSKGFKSLLITWKAWFAEHATKQQASS